MIKRLTERPVVEAGSVPGYGPIFNAGLIHHEDRYHLFARAVKTGYRRNQEPGPRFLDYVSDVLVLISDDGLEYRFQRVLAASGTNGVYAYEDPRVQLVQSNGSQHVVMTYTDLPHPASGLPWRIGAHRLRYQDGAYHLDDHGRVIGPQRVPDKDAVIFNLSDGRVAFMHRVHPNIQLAVFDTLDELLAAGDDYWENHLVDLESHTVLRPSPGSLGIGAGAPPVQTRTGLLFFYHERNAQGTYTINVALLDPETGTPAVVGSNPIMRPELEWEVSGDVDNVVFVQGAYRRADGTIYLTYGSADRHVGAAKVDEEALLSWLQQTQTSTGSIHRPRRRPRTNLTTSLAPARTLA